MPILDIFQITLFDPTVNRGVWTMLLLMPIIFIATILFPMIFGKKGSIAASVLSFIPVGISLITFLWALFMIRSAIVNTPAGSVQATLFSGISFTLVTLYLGTLLTLFLLFFTSLFTAVFKKSRGNSVAVPIILIVIVGTYSGWIRHNILRYSALANAATFDAPRSKLLESLFTSDDSARRIAEHEKYKEYAVRFYITQETVYNSVNERTEEIGEQGPAQQVIEHMAKFSHTQTQMVRHGLINEIPSRQTVLFEYSADSNPLPIDSTLIESVLTSGFTDLEIRQGERREFIEMRGKDSEENS